MQESMSFAKPPAFNSEGVEEIKKIEKRSKKAYVWI